MGIAVQGLATRVAVGAGALVLGVGGLTACSSSSTPSTPSESPTVSTSPTESVAEKIKLFNKKIQEELNAVGCATGPVDGKLGPETDAAIQRFQEASGLSATGELNASTLSALKRATAEGKQVCGVTTPTPTVTVTPTPTITQAGASCTAVSIAKALPEGATLNSYICANVSAERWAAGQMMQGPSVENFFLQEEADAWVKVPNDQVCGTASAGLPAKLLKFCGMT